MQDTVIIAGQGALPALLADALGPRGLVCALEGFGPAGAEAFRIERLVPFLESLLERGIVRVVFAGAVSRPHLDPALFDPRTAGLVPRLLGAMQAGDDAALRAIIGIFEEFGLEVIGAQEIVPDLVPAEGVLLGAPSAQDARDVARAEQIVAGLGALDLGQGAVVAGGLCLATESLPGTDAMLAFAAQHQGMKRGAKGVLYKAPKPAQDLRVDLPAIGVQTVIGAQAAGLAGIAFAAGGVMILERARVLAEAEARGIFLWAYAA